MINLTQTWRLALAAAAGAAVMAATPALANDQSHQSCFPANEWQGWKSPSPDVIYIRVFLHDIYRLDLTSGSSQLSWPDSHLVTKFRGSDWVCSPLDLEMYVSDGHGFREPLIVKRITKLTPEEAAAIPPKFRP